MENMDEVLSLTQTEEILNYKAENSQSNNSVQLTKVMKRFRSGDHVALYQGVYKGRPVVIKYYRKGRKDMMYEISIMKYAQRIGMPIYWFSSSFTLLGYPVLVMEKLVHIGPHDDIKQLMLDVLLQMKYLHKFCCHCDIKDGNVMKISPESNKLYNNPYAKGLTYFMIDYGGCAKKKDRYGYVRHTYTPNFTSQTQKRPLIVTFIHDLLELCYLGNYLLTKRSTNREFDRRHDIHPQMMECYNYVISLKPESSYDPNVHDKLIELVKKYVPN